MSYFWKKNLEKLRLQSWTKVLTVCFYLCFNIINLNLKFRQNVSCIYAIKSYLHFGCFFRKCCFMFKFLFFFSSFFIVFRRLISFIKIQLLRPQSWTKVLIVCFYVYFPFINLNLKFCQLPPCCFHMTSCCQKEVI